MSGLAVSLRSSPEKTNGAKLSRLIIDGGRTALQKVFDSIHPPGTLQATFNSQYSTLLALHKKRILNKTQWELLFPPSGAEPQSTEFDITLLFVLLRNICGLSPPASGWDSKPPVTDTSREASLARIKWFRNEVYGHVTSTGIDAGSFNAHWTELSDALVQLGLDRTEIDRLKNSPLDEDCFLNLLSEWKIQEDDFKTKLEELKKLESVDSKLDVLLSKNEGIVGDIKCQEDEAHVIGKGSKGTLVYSGKFLPSGQSVAVKRMFAGMFDLREAKRLRRLQHPNIIQCFAVEKRGDFIYLALELCKKTLRSCMDENDFMRKDSEVERLKCLKEITAAVEYLHKRKICHRDIKPDNILLSVSDPKRFVLADFNTSKEVRSTESASTQFGSAVGTPGYIAPEMYRPGETVTVKTDIFSLGCVFYFTLTDKSHPFGSVQHLKRCQANINSGQDPTLKEAEFLEHTWIRYIIEAMVLIHPDKRP